MRKNLRIAVLISLAAMTGCADFNGLADNAKPGLAMPSNLPNDAPAGSPDSFATPAEIKAKGVIKKGDTHGTYNGMIYNCGNADCSIAIRAPTAIPGTQANGAKK